MIDLQKIAILGNGYIGSELRSRFGKAIKQPDRETTKDTVALKKYFDREKPHLIINAAGYCGSVNVDSCEEDAQKTFEDNTDLVTRLCIATQPYDIPLHHLSTGCVFSGGPFSEDEEPNLTHGNYRKSKLSAEDIIRELGPPAKVIWRIRMPFDGRRHPRNVFTKLMGYDRIVNGQNSLTSVTDFVDMLEEAVQGIPSGIYNAVNLGSAQNTDIVALLGKEAYEVIEEDELDTRTPRSFCTLSSDKLVSLGLALPPVEESLVRDAELYLDGGHE